MPSVLYVAIENGIVTDKQTGALPAFADPTYYRDITDEDPEPDIGWYFDPVCLVFSEDPPVIPPGDIAPPYWPGEIPPVRGTPEYPVGPIDPGVVPDATTIPVDLTLHSDANEPVTVTAYTDLTEIPGCRKRFITDRACAVRVQGNVDTPVDNTEIVLCYFDGANWVPCSAGGTGPVLDASVADNEPARFLNLVEGAMGDVWFAPHVRGGDDAAPLVVSNLSAQFLMRVDDGVCPPIDEGDCSLPGGIVETDFTEWPTTDDLLAGSPAIDGVLLNDVYAVNSTDIAKDPTTPFNEVDTIKGSFKASGDGGPMFYSNYYGIGGASTLWHMVTTKLDDGFLGGNGGSSTLRGFSLFEVSLRDHSNSPPGRLNYEAWWEVVDDRVLFSFYQSPTFIVTRDDVCAIADLTGRFIRLFVTAEVMGDDTVRLRLLGKDACEESPPEIIDERIVTVDRVWASFDMDVYTCEQERAPLADHDYWVAQMAYHTNLAVIGL